MKQVYIVIFISVIFTHLYAQQHVITVKSEVNTFDKTVNLIAENSNFSTYTLSIKFSTLNGYETSIQKDNLIDIPPGAVSVGKLTRIPKQSSYSYHYKLNYFVGKALTNFPDSNFIYLLPASINKLLFCSNKVTSIQERIGQKKPSDYHFYIFHFQLGDTVFAIRSGTLYSLADEMKEGEQNGQTFTASRDKIRIEHRDGTLAFYDFTAPVTMLAGIGDKIIAGQPLAVFNTASDKMHVLIGVKYLDNKKLNNYLFANFAEDTKKDIYGELPLKFCIENGNAAYITDNATFKVSHPLNIITQEMSKKEKKKFGL